jgi:hypothetical protein
MFAFFSEEIVRHWAACQEAPYCNVGRPVIWDTDGKLFHVLDFTLERRSDGRRYVAELKCEIEFEKYAFLELTGPSQVHHHEKGAATTACWVAFSRATSGCSELPRSFRCWPY